MAFSEQQLEAQRLQIEMLKDELSKLNAQFDAQLKAIGLTPADLAVDENALTPAQMQQWQAIQQEAKRAGAARATQCTQDEGGHSPVPGAGRRNIVRL